MRFLILGIFSCAKVNILVPNSFSYFIKFIEILKKPKFDPLKVSNFGFLRIPINFIQWENKFGTRMLTLAHEKIPKSTKAHFTKAVPPRFPPEHCFFTKLNVESAVFSESVCILIPIPGPYLMVHMAQSTLDSQPRT